MGGKQQPGGGSVRDGRERERCLTFCQEKGVFSSTVQSGHVYSIHLFKKKHNLLFPVCNTRYFKAIKIFKVVCFII